MSYTAATRIAAILVLALACTPAATVTTDGTTSATVAVPAPVPTPAVTAEGTEMLIRTNAGLTFTDIPVPGFAPGLKIATLQGDPSSAGSYTIRLQFPAGYNFPVHWHPNAEHLTVISGTFRVGMGTTANAASLQTYGPGDYLFIPGRMPHFGGVTGPTVIQLHGIGPFAINLGAP